MSFSTRLQLEARSFLQVSHLDTGTQAFEPSCATFPGTWAGSWIGSELAGMWTWAHKRCPTAPELCHDHTMPCFYTFKLAVLAFIWLIAFQKGLGDAVLIVKSYACSRNMLSVCITVRARCCNAGSWGLWKDLTVYLLCYACNLYQHTCTHKAKWEIVTKKNDRARE